MRLTSQGRVEAEAANANNHICNQGHKVDCVVALPQYGADPLISQICKH